MEQLSTTSYENEPSSDTPPEQQQHDMIDDASSFSCHSETGELEEQEQQQQQPMIS
jgi:hypothetical protein